MSVAELFTERKSMFWKHALANCGHRNETVTFPNSTAGVSKLIKFMKDNDIYDAWIGLTLTELKEPAWETKNDTGFYMLSYISLLLYLQLF